MDLQARNTAKAVYLPYVLFLGKARDSVKPSSGHSFSFLAKRELVLKPSSDYFFLCSFLAKR